MISVVVLAIGAFVSTNLDDIFVLMAFFAERKYRTWQVVVGQFLGIAALFALGLLGSRAVQLVPTHLVHWLGLLPIAIGVKALLFDRKNEEWGEEPSWAHHVSRVAAVTLVTVSNGGDNIAVYVPLFAHHSGPDLALFGVVFVVCTAVWCGLALALTRHPLLAHPVQKWGSRLLPFVLITIGVVLILSR